MAWAIWYSEDDYITSEDYPDLNLIPKEKRFGIQVITQSHLEVVWHTQRGDYYVYEARGGEPRWFAVDRDGLLDYLTEPGPKRPILVGRTIERAAFARVFNAAQQHPLFGKKATFLREEIRPDGA